MARVYLSFLGATDYLQCTYYFNQKEAANVRFVQEATIQFFAGSWGSEDRICIFTTEEAHQKNWLDNGHTGKNGETLERLGLESRLTSLGIAPSLKRVSVPEGKSEEEIWQIFQAVFDQLDSWDQVVFDITHAFRSIPMLAMVVLNYAKVMKEVTLGGIYYGAFEVLGSLQEARNIPLPERRVPVLDLTSFDLLLDWTLGIDRFLGAGDATPACLLARKAIHPVLKATKGQDQAAKAVRQIADQLETFSKVLSTCRGREISLAAARLKDLVRRCASIDLLPPFKPLLGRLRDQAEAFDGNPVSDGIRAAKWCLEHNLIQQGYTILREILVGHIVSLAGADPENLEHREMASQAVGIFRKKDTQVQEEKVRRDREAMVSVYMEIFRKKPELGKILGSVSDARNDINHAGFRPNPRRSGSFYKNLGKLIDQAEELVRGS